MSLRTRVPDEYYFRWLNDYLREFPPPKPGDECLICKAPIPSASLKLHLQRRVCSKDCNGKKIRKVKRRIDKGVIPHYSKLILHWPDIAAEIAREPRVFGENRNQSFPLELGRWVKDGDSVVRDGVITIYNKLHDENQIHPDLLSLVKQMDPKFEKTLLVSESTKSFQSFVLTDATGRATNTEWPVVRLRDPVYQPIFCRERILHVDEFGIPLIWNVPVFATHFREKALSEERKLFNSKMAAASAARNSYLARARILGIPDLVADLVDVASLKLAHGGYCPICAVELDWGETWPSDFYPTIDHVVPVSKGGQHVAENLQWVHWVCNLKKRDN